MKSLQRRFKNEIEKNPMKSSYICFAEAVKGQGFSKKTIYLWFKKLVDKDDYNKNDKKRLTEHLVNLSNCLEEGRIWGEIGSPLRVY